ncbi:FtsX-like permease family protein [Streptomyces zhaozhouensis]|uniref:FtsX-like permease family protein n=1 Tax=Streptomyces zhaozhouensis TaxID=1300267 RepID=A0A286DRA9_9ACTN|nr:FtsX-like permease family protein [Streptomyces zhaozhouensis]SOD61084.1 FtsX-like permease family protein [Streptomyces zhaozhouensis]
MSAGVRAWARDLRLGLRLSVTGGASAWTRTALTTVGIALGVVILLLAASVPQVLQGRGERDDARSIFGASVEERGEHTLLVRGAGTEYHGERISGVEIQPDAGEKTTAEPPPGVSEIPAPGEIVVSPALARLLDSSEGELLAERMDDLRRVGTIADEGLLGSQELYYYAGVDDMAEAGALRIDSFGQPQGDDELHPVLVLLILVIAVVLLMPVPILITTAARFGGERRDRRLAALRLVGADSGMTRRIAAGESLVGAVLGMALGGLLFLAIRPPLATISVSDTSTFVADITPSPPLALLVVLAVPLLAVGTTLFAMRSVVVEPLGVVRRSRDRPRRLLWRVVPGVLGLGLLALMLNGDFSGSDIAVVQAVAGVTLLLIASTALLPWLVERVTGRLRGGPASWQLATRRLQLSSGPAVRAMSGIMVAVAGATALYMLFDGVREEDMTPTHADLDRAQVEASVSTGDRETVGGAVDELEGIPGVEAVLPYHAFYVPVWREGAEGAVDERTEIVVAECSVLVELAHIEDCAEGEVYDAPPEEDFDIVRPGTGDVVGLHGGFGEELTGLDGLWTVPETREVEPRDSPSGMSTRGLLMTSEALDGLWPEEGTASLLLRADLSDRDTMERIRNVVADLPDGDARALVNERISSQLEGIQTWMIIGASGVLALIGGSMLVTTLEQLRERKRLLAALVAVGARRTTLGFSVLWQTAVPVALGIALASSVGVVLGAMLMSLVRIPLGGWLAFLPMAGAGAGVIALVTVGSLPLLWRLMRPDGLRTE